MVRKVAYVVVKGRETGIFKTWEETRQQVDGFPGAVHQGFTSMDDAEEAWSDAQAALNAPREIMLSPAHTNLKRAAGAMSGIDTTPKKKLKPGPRNYAERRGFDDDNQSTSERGGLRTNDGPADEKTSLSDYEELSAPRKNRVISVADGVDFDDSDPKESDELDAQEDTEESEPPIILSPDQEAVVQLALSGSNIFLSGAAGSGKTVTLKEMKRRIIKKSGSSQAGSRIQVIAPTGIAALPLQGMTTYQLAGWTPASFNQTLSELLGATSKRTKKLLRKLDVIIIEEISMVEAVFLERFNLLLKHVMASKLPFGGKQAILLGDFHQLPPVRPFIRCLTCGEQMDLEQQDGPVCATNQCQPFGRAFTASDKWAFKAPVWKELNMHHVMLEQIFRQKDSDFRAILNKVRNGEILTDNEWIELKRPKQLPDGAFSVQLMSKKKAVNSYNEKELRKIKTATRSWRAVDGWKKASPVEEEDDEDGNIIQNPIDTPDLIKEAVQEYLQNHTFDKRLTLKLGAKVVLLYNLSPGHGLVNGSQGEVIRFVKTEAGRQRPVVGDNKVWRQHLINKFQAQTETSWRPVVRFTNGVVRVIPAIASQSLLGANSDPWVVCMAQIPLTLAWALSMHKSQGMTLENVTVSAENIFEPGQLYVALSRATRMEGLTVTGFEKDQLAVDPDVLEFYATTQWEKPQLVAEELSSADSETEDMVAGEENMQVHEKDEVSDLNMSAGDVQIGGDQDTNIDENGHGNELLDKDMPSGEVQVGEDAVVTNEVPLPNQEHLAHDLQSGENSSVVNKAQPPSKSDAPAVPVHDVVDLTGDSDDDVIMLN